MTKAKVGYWIRLSIGVAVMALVIVSIDLGQLPRIAELEVPYLVAIVVIAIADRLLNSLRWYLLVEAHGLDVSLGELTRIYFKSCFVGLILPSNVAGELVKGYGLYTSTAKAVRSFSTILVERVFGLLSLVLLVYTGSHFVKIPGAAVEIATVRFIAALGLLTPVVAIVGYRILERSRAGIHLVPSKIRDRLAELNRALAEFKNEGLRLCVVFLLSLVIQLLRVLIVFAAGKAVGVDLNFLTLAVVVPFVYFLAMIPITIGGLGVQEGGYVYSLGLVGISPGMSLAVAILVRVATIVSVLPGAIPYSREGFGKKVERGAQGPRRRRAGLEGRKTEDRAGEDGI